LVTQDIDDEDQEEDGWKEDPTMYTQHDPYIPVVEGSYYNDLKYYLQHGTTPEHLNTKQKRALRLKYLQYQLVHGILFQRTMMEYYFDALKNKMLIESLRTCMMDQQEAISQEIQQLTRY
jgi:hypothetical protein